METFRTIVTSLAIALIPSIGTAELIVDPSIDSPSCTTYQSSNRNCIGGSQTAYKTISGAANVAGPGETVFIRQGTYNEQLAPANSGTSDNPITYKNYTSETVTITGSLRPAVDLTNRSHITVQGLIVTDVDRWLYLVNAAHNTVMNNTFRNATDGGGGAKTGIFLLDSSFNKIVNNLIENNPADSLTIVRSERNVVDGNTFRDAGHALWAVRCGNFNVIRNNFLYNSNQKIGEVYDCANTSGVTSYDDTKYNLIESNEFAYTPSSGNRSPYSGIQYAGQSGIIRNNLFHSTTGPGLRMAIYGTEANYNNDNRIVQNTFVGTNFSGIDFDPGASMSGNIFKNNILADSSFVANDSRWNWWVYDVDGKPVQVKTSRLNGFLFDTNAIYSPGSDLDWLITCGFREPCSGWGGQKNISWWEDNYPDLVRNSIINNPGFVNTGTYNFQLSENSPLIDQGTYLTTTTGAGSGTLIPVNDAGYFFDGFGIPGETGDEIQLGGTSQKATIVEVDFAANTITVDRTLNWSANQGVTYAYLGNKPDLGAFERGNPGTTLAPPSPPILLE